MRIKLIIVVVSLFGTTYAFSNNTASGANTNMGGKDNGGTKVATSDGPIDWFYNFFKNSSDSTTVKSDSLNLNNVNRKAYPSSDRVVY